MEGLDHREDLLEEVSSRGKLPLPRPRRQSGCKDDLLWKRATLYLCINIESYGSSIFFTEAARLKCIVYLYLSVTCRY